MKQEKDKKTKRIPLWKTLSIAFLLLGIFVAVGYSTFIAGPIVDTSSTTQTSGETEDKGKVKVDFRYQICDGMEVITYPEEALGIVNGDDYQLESISIGNDKDKYEKFQTLVETLTGAKPGDLATGKYQYSGTGDWSGYYIVILVTEEIKFTDGGICGSDSYSGQYTISKQKKEESSYHYSYETDIKFSAYLKSGGTLSDLRSLVTEHLNDVSAGYTFVGFKETSLDEEGNPYPNDILLSEDAIIEEDAAYYLVLNSDNDLSEYKNNLSDTITNLQSGEKTFNAEVAQGDENVTNDLSYFEGDRAVFLMHETTIHEGVTINFGLNDGNIKQSASVTGVSNFEPENSAHELQYKVVLQEDMVIDGTLLIGSDYGVSGSQASNGLITDEYVCLDLNGHNITINSTGKLESYGLIKDSKGTGTIFVKGGSIQTLATIQDYRGGGATSKLVSGKVFPFEVYSLPYLRCHVQILMDSNRQFGEFLALAHVNYMSSSRTEVVLNFIGPEGGDSFLFSISNPQLDSSVDIYGYSHKAMEEDAKMTETDRQAVLSKRMKIQLNNVVCNMNALKFNISVPIDTSEYFFPISGFFDIMLCASTIVISQRIKFMPGSSFFADETSVVALSYNDQRSAQVIALGNNYYYYDSQYEKFVNNDYMDGGDGAQGQKYRRSDVFAKYFSFPRIYIYGTLAIRQGNTESNSSPYVLAGNINFNRVAYYSDDLSARTYVDYEEQENPFTKIVSDSSGATSFSTYSFSSMLGGVTGLKEGYKTYFSKGYSLPLVSNGICYYQNTTQTNGSVGTFDSRTGEMLFDGSHYILESTRSYSSSATNDDGSCSLIRVTKDSDLPVYQDDNGGKYIFFAGMYSKFSPETDSTGTADCSRTNDKTKSMAVKFDSTLNRWLRA